MKDLQNSSVYALPGLMRNRGRDEDILVIVAEYFGLGLERIKERTRKESVCIPRQIAMYLYRRQTRLSLSRIGSLCGGYGHSNVLHAERAIANAIETGYKSVGEDVLRLESLIG